MSARGREKFQDSNALIQLSRQLQAKQAADSSVTTDNTPADPGATHQRTGHAGTQLPSVLNPVFSQRSFVRKPAVAELVWCPSASSKRRKLQGSSLDDEGLIEDIPKRRKQAAKTMPASMQPVAQIDASTAGEAANKQASAAEQGGNKSEFKTQKLQTAIIPEGCFKEQAPCDFVTWYSKICTHRFADGLSALHQGHDSSHAHPSLIARCIRMNACVLGAKEGILQTIYQPWHLSPFQHVSQWL